MTATSAAPTVATFPLRPPAWVRVWAGALGTVAVAVALLVGVPEAASGRWAYLAPVVVVVALAAALVWRIGGLVTRPAADGTLLVRNRTRTHRLTRAQVRTVRAGTGRGRAATPLVVLVLADGTEVAVDATMSAAFQGDQLDAQVAALRAWQRG